MPKYFGHPKVEVIVLKFKSHGIQEAHIPGPSSASNDDPQEKWIKVSLKKELDFHLSPKKKGSL